MIILLREDKVLLKRTEPTKHGLIHEDDYDNDITFLLTTKLAMCHGLDMREIVVCFLMASRDFSPQTGSGTNQTSYQMGTGKSLPIRK
jgi:hypothetical protein